MGKFLKEISEEMNKIIILISIGFLVSSCTQSSIKKEYYESGELKSEIYFIDGKLTGERKIYYPNGNVMEIHNVSDGINYFKKFYEEGSLAEEGGIKNKKRVGFWHYYYKDGGIKASGSYYEDGLKEGKWLYYDKDDISKVVFWDRIIDSSMHFKINIPRDWSLRSEKGDNVFIATPTDKDEVLSKNVSLNVISFDVIGTLSLNEFLIQNIGETAKAYKESNYKLLNEGVNKINGLRANWYAFSIDKNDQTHFVIQYFVETEFEVFQISFFVLQEYYYDYLNLYKEIAFSFAKLRN